MCSHKPDSNNFCMFCGLELEYTQNLVPDTAYKNTIYKNTTYKSNGKYTATPIPTDTTILDHILNYLNAQHYKHQILEFIKNTNFIYRISFLDKALLSIYHILSRDGFSILFSDLEKFSTNNTNLLSKYFKIFGSRKPTNLYLKNVQNRICEKLKIEEKIYKNTKLEIEEKIYKNTKLEIVILGILLRNEENLDEIYKKYKIEEFCNLSQLKRVLKKNPKKNPKEEEIKKDKKITKMKIEKSIEYLEKQFL